MVHLSTFFPVVLMLLSGQLRDGYKDPPTPTFGHLTRAENELKPEQRRFMRDLNSRFEDLWEYFGEAENRRLKLAGTDPATSQVSEAKQEYRAALGRVERSASGLRHKLASMLEGMERQKALEWTADLAATSEPFKQEMDFIRYNIREAELRFQKRTEGIVFTEGENLLIRLDWVRRMAKHLRRDLGN